MFCCERSNACRGETGELDNTLIFYIIGDNGTSAEGGMFGMFRRLYWPKEEAFNGKWKKPPLKKTK